MRRFSWTIRAALLLFIVLVSVSGAYAGGDDGDGRPGAPSPPLSPKPFDVSERIR